MRVVLKQSRKPDWTRDVLGGDPSAFEVGASVEIAGDPSKFTVGERTVVVEADGATWLDVRLKSDRRWFTWLDERAARNDVLYPLTGVAVSAVLLVGCATPLWFLSLDPETRIAWGGFLIANAQWPFGIGVGLAAQIVAGAAEPRVGTTIGFGVRMAGWLAGIGVAYVWGRLFLPESALEWPGGYARLARAFWENTGSMSAVALAYLPLATALIKWDGAAVLGFLLKRKTAT